MFAYLGSLPMWSDQAFMNLSAARRGRYVSVVPESTIVPLPVAKIAGSTPTRQEDRSRRGASLSSSFREARGGVFFKARALARRDPDRRARQGKRQRGSKKFLSLSRAARLLTRERSAAFGCDMYISPSDHDEDLSTAGGPCCSLFLKTPVVRFSIDFKIPMDLPPRRMSRSCTVYQPEFLASGVKTIGSECNRSSTPPRA